MTSSETDAAQDILISEEAMRSVLGRVLDDADNARPVQYSFDSTLEEVGLDSLLIAGVIVELEEELDVLLDLQATERLVTLGDLCRALRPVGSSS
ncbi:phosphopantetheine-binding protein [Streptacidiphilus griseoplanus]|uniref:phosphopantetheine-binding protein n=1 Tax=Peterkaempfera griseoplana TaxID=66896 RepID=UPI0006E37F98|nr:phosphopantetheine-binding protein [Peterkaempfera griseoplana]